MGEKIGIVGCGVMGKAILAGIIASGKWHWDAVRATVKDEAEMAKVQKELPQLSVTLDNSALLQWADVVILWYTLRPRERVPNGP
jgi:pyrroline-5-carboxylate reductase